VQLVASSSERPGPATSLQQLLLSMALMLLFLVMAGFVRALAVGTGIKPLLEPV